MISSPLMTVMVDAVRKAARGLKRDYGEIENLQVSRKGPGNFVSAAEHLFASVACPICGWAMARGANPYRTGPRIIPERSMSAPLPGAPSQTA